MVQSTDFTRPGTVSGSTLPLPPPHPTPPSSRSTFSSSSHTLTHNVLSAQCPLLVYGKCGVGGADKEVNTISENCSQDTYVIATSQCDSVSG